MTAEAVLRERRNRKVLAPSTSRFNRNVGHLDTATGFGLVLSLLLPQVCEFPVDPVQGRGLVEGGIKPPVPLNVGGVKACRIEPQLLSKLGAQAFVLLTASHNYSSAVGPVVRRSCPAPDGNGRFVIRATQ